LNRNIFENIVKTYFPLKINYTLDSELYIASPEFIKLEERLSENDIFRVKYDNYITLLNKGIGFKFYAVGYHHLERCLTYQCNLGLPYRLNVDISLLGPFFTAYVVERDVKKSIKIKDSMDLLSKLQLSKNSEELLVLKKNQLIFTSLVEHVINKLKSDMQLIYIDYFESLDVIFLDRFSLDFEEKQLSLFSALFKDKLVFV
tara:strand:+ start:2076 stop:2681 length:606 start_codon:yes stop_codon:yes gene_type:complete